MQPAAKRVPHQICEDASYNEVLIDLEAVRCLLLCDGRGSRAIKV